MKTEITDLKSSKIKDQSSNVSSSSRFDLEERTAIFGENILLLCKAIALDAITRPLVNQLVRSGTSVGANYHEANNASSKKDFRNKVYIAKKEVCETKYWLRMLATATTGKEKELAILQRETQELLLILQAIINKVENNEK